MVLVSTVVHSIAARSQYNQVGDVRAAYDDRSSTYTVY
jgi:hypothetical protein